MQSIPENKPLPQFATYQEAVASIPDTAVWSSSFGDHMVGLDVYFRDGGKRWVVSNHHPLLGGWTVQAV